MLSCTVQSSNPLQVSYKTEVKMDLEVKKVIISCRTH